VEELKLLNEEVVKEEHLELTIGYFEDSSKIN
jgi:hypothetical protein